MFLTMYLYFYAGIVSRFRGFEIICKTFDKKS